MIRVMQCDSTVRVSVSSHLPFWDTQMCVGGSTFKVRCVDVDCIRVPQNGRQLADRSMQVEQEASQ
jgi:hypothetical protein